MFDLNRNLTKLIAEFGLMVTLTVAVTACSHTKMTSDASDVEVTDIQLEEPSETTLNTPTIENEQKIASTSHKSVGHKKHNWRRHHKLAKNVKHQAEIKTEKSEQPLVSGTVSNQINEFPPTPPTAPALIEESTPQSSIQWVYVCAVAFFLVAVATLIRMRRRGAARRLILNS